MSALRSRCTKTRIGNPLASKRRRLRSPALISGARRCWNVRCGRSVAHTQIGAGRARGLRPSFRRAYAARSLPFPESRKGAGGTCSNRETDRPEAAPGGSHLNGRDGIPRSDDLSGRVAAERARRRKACAQFSPRRKASMGNFCRLRFRVRRCLSRERPDGGSRFGGLRGPCAPLQRAQLSQRRRDGRQLAKTRLPPGGRQRRVLGVLDQAGPACDQQPFDRSPLVIVDFQFQSP